MSDKKTNFDDVAKTAVDTAAIKSINASCHKAGSRGIFRFLVNSKNSKHNSYSWIVNRFQRKAMRD